MNEYENVERKQQAARRAAGGAPGECGATDGYSVCTESASSPHKVHWDRHIQHEWYDDDADDQELLHAFATIETRKETGKGNDVISAQL